MLYSAARGCFYLVELRSSIGRDRTRVAHRIYPGMEIEQEISHPAEFEFRGDTYEWLGIWIVNLFLSIVTFGIYSAWAKVRMKKYFYQHTYVAGRNFDYHATGLQILIGRIIVIVGLVLVSILSAIPVVGLAILVLLLVLIPWLLVRALRFNAVMSSWSNVRFGFDGKGGAAFLVYILYPVLSALTFYLAWPFADRARRRFSISNHRLGAARFAFDSPIGPFYRAFLVAIGWFVLVGAILAALAVVPVLTIAQNPEHRDQAASQILSLIVYAFIFLAVFPAGTLYAAFIRNAAFNGATLDGTHRFHSDVHPLRLVWIVVSNAVAVLMTVGLMLPWAQVRLARYYAAHTVLLPGGSLDDFAGRLEARTTALGDAYTDIEGFDVGLPI